VLWYSRSAFYLFFGNRWPDLQVRFLASIRQEDTTWSMMMRMIPVRSESSLAATWDPWIWASSDLCSWHLMPICILSVLRRYIRFRMMYDVLLGYVSYECHLLSCSLERCYINLFPSFCVIDVIVVILYAVFHPCTLCTVRVCLKCTGRWSTQAWD
jgi:hypothetical protein